MVHADAPKYTSLDTLRIVIFILLTVLGPNWGLMFASDRFEPYEHVGWALRLLWSLPLAAVIVGLLALVGRLMLGSRLWIMGSIYSFIYGPLMAFQLVGFFNVSLDSSPGSVHEVEVVSLSRRQKGNDKLVLKSWEDASSTVSLNASFFPSSAYKPGARVRVRVHGGALGLSWVQPQPLAPKS